MGVVVVEFYEKEVYGEEFVSECCERGMDRAAGLGV